MNDYDLQGELSERLHGNVCNMGLRPDDLII